MSAVSAEEPLVKASLTWFFQDITAHMNLHSITDRIWQIQACSAMTGDGLQEGSELQASLLA